VHVIVLDDDAAGDTLDEIEAWCDAYACRWADLIEVIRLLAAEHEAST